MPNGGSVERLPYTRKHFKTIEEYMRQWLVDMGFVGRFGLGLITGNLGAGKSLFGYTIAWWVKKLFGMQITVDQRPEAPFGKYTLFNVHEDILKEKELIDKIAQRGSEWTGPEVEQLKLYKTFAFFDEFYKVAHNRSSMGVLTREFEDIVKQIRHMDSFFLLAMPHKNEVDVKGIDQYVNIDVQAAWCLFRPDTAVYTVYNRDTTVESPFTIYGPNYYAIYNSKNPITTRKSIDTKDYKKWQRKMSANVIDATPVGVE